VERASRIARARYPVPWDLVARAALHVAWGARGSLEDYCREIAARMSPPPAVSGLENIPPDPRFLLAANHYQRRGLWIVHAAAALTMAVRDRLGPGVPALGWVVTANWPGWRIGPWRFRSPGDWMLRRLADALDCYAVPFAGSDPVRTAAAYRRLLRDAASARRPIGLFPEGARGAAGRLGPALPGVDRLLRRLALAGLRVLPAGVSEADRRLVVRFGPALAAEQVLAAKDAAELVMARIAAAASAGAAAG